MTAPTKEDQAKARALFVKWRDAGFMRIGTPQVAIGELAQALADERPVVTEEQVDALRAQAFCNTWVDPETKSIAIEALFELFADIRAEARREGAEAMRERCARILDRALHTMDTEMHAYAKYFAAAIRALKPGDGQ